jgi:phosphoglycerol transferase MdoB-like AlkP superfamily enzyme
MLIIIEIIGWVGSAAVIVAYALISAKKIPATSRLYQLLNLIGSICLIVNTGYYRAYPSTFVNAVWSVIAAFALVRIVSSRSAAG